MESRIYSSPGIERIDLDTEISLVLQSVDDENPPYGPFESKLQTPMYFNDSVVKTELTWPKVLDAVIRLPFLPAPCGYRQAAGSERRVKLSSNLKSPGDAIDTIWRIIYEKYINVKK